MRETVAFYAGLAVVAIGLGAWLIRPNEASGKFEFDFLGFKFSVDAPALAVMIIGISLMILSARFHIDPSPAVKKIVCTGEIESNCPGAHDIFYTCGYFPTDDAIAKNVCSEVQAGHVRLKTVGGNMCGYALIEVDCPQ